MKMLGRKHRQFFRIVAIDSRQPRDGRIIEELGTYDPKVKNTDDRVTLRPDRIKYWLSVGALPSEKCAVFFRKYMKKFEEQQAAAGQPQGQAEATPTTGNHCKLKIANFQFAIFNLQFAMPDAF